jgi:Fibronectin type III domain
VSNIRIVSIGANFFTIAWDAPQNRHFEIETYEVLYNADGSTSENMSFGYTKQPNVTLDNLLQQTKYAFKVSDVLPSFRCADVTKTCRKILTKSSESNVHADCKKKKREIPRVSVIFKRTASCNQRCNAAPVTIICSANESLACGTF